MPVTFIESEGRGVARGSLAGHSTRKRHKGWLIHKSSKDPEKKQKQDCVISVRNMEGLAVSRYLLEPGRLTSGRCMPQVRDWVA